MRIFKKAGFCIGCLFLVLGMAFSVHAAPKMAKSSVSLKTGNAYVLRLKGNSKGKKVTWKTSAKSVVQISFKNNNRAVLKAKAKGTATITAKVGKKTLACKVKVGKNKGFPAKLTLTVGDKYKFSSSKPMQWGLSNTNGKLKVGQKKKKAIFTAEKAGKCKVTILTGDDDEKSCMVTILRKDGTEEADQADEEATDDSQGKESETSKKKRKEQLISMACTACQVIQADTHVSKGEYYASDFDNKTKAYLLYQYLNTADDSRIKTQGGYYMVEVDELKAMLGELFGETNHTNTMDFFKDSYAADVASGTSNVCYVEPTSIFEASGSCYFDKDFTETVENSMHILTGKVMTMTGASSYTQTGTYKVRFLILDNGKYQYNSVKVQ